MLISPTWAVLGAQAGLRQSGLAVWCTFVQQTDWNSSVVTGLCGQSLRPPLGIGVRASSGHRSLPGHSVTKDSSEVSVGDEWIVFVRLHLPLTV